MCGRYTLRTDADVLSAEFHLTRVPKTTPRYNVAPTQPVPVITDEAPDTLQSFRWGLVPFWAKDLSVGSRMINARAETAHEKPAFRRALEKRRCLVLADGYYEWKKDGKRKVPHLIHRRGDRPFAFAGLWESWRPSPEADPIHTCTFLTTAPCPSVAGIHDRMPVLLTGERARAWLAPGPLEASQREALLRPYEEDDLEAYAVSTLVNTATNESAACVLPAAPEPAALPLFS
ncbi:MAG TPA: SOS response-associated peptidase [Myxococcaceae bacterium]|nr:SOS response-associated peptidase [Myxococcaceae bacterium]